MSPTAHDIDIAYELTHLLVTAIGMPLDRRIAAARDALPESERPDAMAMEFAVLVRAYVDTHYPRLVPITDLAGVVHPMEGPMQKVGRGKHASVLEGVRDEVAAAIFHAGYDPYETRGTDPERVRIDALAAWRRHRPEDVDARWSDLLDRLAAIIAGDVRGRLERERSLVLERVRPYG